MEEHELRVPRTARIATLGPLAGPVDATWVVLHGFGQLASRFARRFAPLDDGRTLVVAPEGLSRYYVDHQKGVVGATWMTREARQLEIADYVRYLDEVVAWLSPAALAAPRTVLGFSQGSATAWRWVTHGTTPPPRRLLIWGGEVPPDLDLASAAARLASTAVTLVAGSADPVCPPTRLARYQTLLADAGIRAETRTTPGGHDIDAEALRAFAT